MNRIISLLLVMAVIIAGCTSESTVQLKVMSYNIRNAKGMDNVRNIDRVAQVILNAAPDVVAVQELDSMTNRSGNKYILGELGALVNMHAEFFPAIEFDGGKYGIGILSKVKPIGVKGYNLPGREEKRAVIVAEYDNYMLACVHLSLTEEDRMSSLEIVEKIALESKKPFLLAGDMNALADSPFIEKLKENFYDGWYEYFVWGAFCPNTNRR